MSSSNSDVICQFCNRTFSARRYYLCHFKYKSNVRCKNLFYGLSNNEVPSNLPQKRAMEDTSDLCNNASNHNYLGDANVTGSPDSLHHGNSSCVNVTLDSPIFYPDPDDDDVSIDSCGNTQDDHTPTTSTTFNSFVNDDMFESNTTNTSNDSFVNDDMGTYNNNIHEATFGDTEILEDFHKYSQDSYKNRCSLTAEDCAGIELLEVLAKARAPLNLYDFIYTWQWQTNILVSS